MADNDFNPTALLAGYLKETDPDQAVKLARELCGQLEGDPDSFHGGIWPGNVDLDVEGKAQLGPSITTPANQRPADQVEFVAPEFFWDGAGSAAADVYSIGLMLYAGCNGGYLPFQPQTGSLTDQDRSNALRRRMKGEAVTAPEGVSDELKKVMEKALAYDPERRYITAREFLTALSRTDEALPSASAVAGAAGAASIAAAVIGAAVGADKADEADNAEETGEAQEAGGSVPMDGDGADLSPQTDQAPAEDSSAPAAESAEAPAADSPEEDAFRPGDEPEAQAEAGRESASADAATVAAAGVAVTAAAAGKAGPERSKTSAKGKNGKRGKNGKNGKNSKASKSGSVNAAPAGSRVRSSDGTPSAAAEQQTAPAISPARTGARQQYKVQKDFESAPRAQRAQSTVPAAQRKKKKSAAVPILCGVAAAALLGGAGYWFLLRPDGKPTASEPFTPPAVTEAAQGPMIVSPQPEDAEASATPVPTPTPSATARPTATPSATDNGELNISVVGADGRPITGTGTGTGTATGTGAGSGTATGGTAGGTTTGGYTGGTTSGGTTGGYTGGTTTGGYTGGGYTGGTTTGTTTGGTSGGTTGGSSNSFTVTAAGGTVYLTGDEVRVRTGPGTNYGIIGAVSRGDYLTRTGTVASGWTQVTYNGVTGYIYSQYLTDQTPEPTATPATTAAPGTAAPEPTATPEPTTAPATTYQASAESLSYDDAVTAAQTAGGKLATGQTDAAFAAITAALTDSAKSYVWVGVAYQDSLAGWAWTDDAHTPISSELWASGYPLEGEANFALLAKQDDGSWKFITVTGDELNAAPYLDALGYVLETATA